MVTKSRGRFAAYFNCVEMLLNLPLRLEPIALTVAMITTHGERQMSKLYAFLKDESGATAIEYGLIAAGIYKPHGNPELLRNALRDLRHFAFSMLRLFRKIFTDRYPWRRAPRSKRAQHALFRDEGTGGFIPLPCAPN